MSALGEWDEPEAAAGASQSDAGADAGNPGAATPPPPLHYAHLEDFVGDYLVRIYRRSLSGPSTAWCPEWWRHPEAYARLEALWRAWEHLRLDPATGMSVWFRDHADHHMAVLLSSDGPFKGCEGKGHGEHPLEPLPVATPPEALRDLAGTYDTPPE